MYPFIRLAFHFFAPGAKPHLNLGDTHVTQHICWPWDIDPWMELNNGRTLTIYDLGRLPFAKRSGLLAATARRKWGVTVAGSVVRYRRRVRPMERFEIRSRAVGWDSRFLYVEQAMWKRNGDCANHGVLRMAVTSKDGIVSPKEVTAELGISETSPPLPTWVLTWLEAETQRPWPPMQD